MYYLIKSVNNVPFIYGQFEDFEEARETYLDTPRTPGVSYHLVGDILGLLEEKKSLEKASSILNEKLSLLRMEAANLRGALDRANSKLLALDQVVKVCNEITRS